MREIYSMLKSSSFGLLLPLVFLVGTCVLVLIFSFSLSLISYYTKLYANWLSDPRWYHFYCNWCNCYCYSFPFPPWIPLDLVMPRAFSDANRSPHHPSETGPSESSGWIWVACVLIHSLLWPVNWGQRLVSPSPKCLELAISLSLILLSIRAYGTYRPYLNL